LSLLSQPGREEEADDSPAEALRRFLTDVPQGRRLPKTGWRVLARSDEEVEYGSGNASNLAAVTVVLDADGQWVGVGQQRRCTLHPIRDGYALQRWVLWDRIPPSDGREFDVHLEFGDPACAGTDPEDVLELEASYTRDAVILAFFARADDVGPIECALTARSTRVGVRLDEDLRSRRILDGSFVPPREARTTAD
jgi:hypothetical protein